MNNIVYKSFAYQFDPLVHVRLTSDKYDNIDMLMADSKLYWMHFEKPSRHLQQQLIKKLAIPKAVRTMLFAEELRPCCLKFDSSLFLAIPGTKPSAIGIHEDVPFLRFWLTANGLVSVSMEPLQSIQDIQADLKTVQDQGHFYCLSTLIQYIISYSEDITYQLDEELDKIEADFEASEQTIVSIMNIRQTIVRLRRYILPQRDALIFLGNKIGEFAPDAIVTSFKDIAETMLRQVDYLEVLRERAIITQDNLANQIGEISNKRMYLLTALMLISTPAFYIMGIFSMYLPIPGMNNHWTWWVLNAVIIVVTVWLYLLFRRKKWL